MKHVSVRFISCVRKFCSRGVIAYLLSAGHCQIIYLSAVVPYSTPRELFRACFTHQGVSAAVLCPVPRPFAEACRAVLEQELLLSLSSLGQAEDPRTHRAWGCEDLSHAPQEVGPFKISAGASPPRSHPKHRADPTPAPLGFSKGDARAETAVPSHGLGRLPHFGLLCPKMLNRAEMILLSSSHLSQAQRSLSFSKGLI